MINGLFSYCLSLTKIPDINKWGIHKVTDARFIFHVCPSLSSLPDICEWETNNLVQIDKIFSDCISSLKVPDISKLKKKEISIRLKIIKSK